MGSFPHIYFKAGRISVVGRLFYETELCHWSWSGTTQLRPLAEGKSCYLQCLPESCRTKKKDTFLYWELCHLLCTLSWSTWWSETGNESQVPRHTYFNTKALYLDTPEQLPGTHLNWQLSLGPQLLHLRFRQNPGSSPCCFLHLCFCSISLFHSLLLSYFKKSAYFLYICMQMKEGSLYWCHFSLQLLVNGIC